MSRVPRSRRPSKIAAGSFAPRVLPPINRKLIERMIDDVSKLLMAHGVGRRDISELLERVRSEPILKRKSFIVEHEGLGLRIDSNALNVHARVTTSEFERRLKYKCPPDIIPPT